MRVRALAGRGRAPRLAGDMCKQRPTVLLGVVSTLKLGLAILHMGNLHCLGACVQESPLDGSDTTRSSLGEPLRRVGRARPP